MLHHKLQIVPAINKQELLLYLQRFQPHGTIKIITDSGQPYLGVVLNVGKTTSDDFVLTLQIVTLKNELTPNVLHITIAKIESIEIFNDAETVLSLGKISKPIIYGESSKIETQRHLNHFAETILNTSAVAVGIPALVLPEDRKSLNRIVKLTSTIEHVILEILKADDAKSSWKSNYTSIAFVENNTLGVIGNSGCLGILFPFSDTEANEIDSEELIGKLLAVL
jgi:hypothetical protein